MGLPGSVSAWATLASTRGSIVIAVSLSTINSGFFDRVGFSALLHRKIGGLTSIGIGAENFEIINGDESDTDVGVYGVVSHIFR